jgi:hypothetical protein
MSGARKTGREDFRGAICCAICIAGDLGAAGLFEVN